jgi:hypothetical protein
MWFHGSVDIPRQTLFKLKNVKTNATWQPKESLYDLPLRVNPYAFAYAAMRTSIVGKHIGLRGSIAGGGLAIASAAYLFKKGMDLEFHPRFNDVKDFIGTGIKGTVGAAFSYLYMMNKGYVWAGHWEDAISKSVAGPHPDFVFASKLDVCLMDAKGSSKNVPDIESLVKKEWKRQIWPNRKETFIFGGTCTEGAIIATRVAPGLSASFIKAHGRFQGVSPLNLASKAIKSVQRANYINACFLLGLHKTAFSMLSRDKVNTAPATLIRELEYSNITGDNVLIAPPRLILQNGNGSYLMRPFADVNFLKKMIIGLYDDSDWSDVILPQTILNTKNQEVEEKILIQGGDGVGAEFFLLK